MISSDFPKMIQFNNETSTSHFKISSRHEFENFNKTSSNFYNQNL